MRPLFSPVTAVIVKGGQSLAPSVYRWFLDLVREINHGTVPVGGIIFANLSAQDVTDYFTSGLGQKAKPYYSWAICDGLNGTPDLDNQLIRGDKVAGGTVGAVASGAGDSYTELVPLMRVSRSG